MQQEEQGERVGVLGGTFDPLHYAHLAIAEEVYYTLKLARVVFVPAGRPPHKLTYPLTPIEQRVTMLEQAIAPNPHFALSLIDARRPGPCYTVDTLRLLRQEWGTQVELFFLVGGDSLRDFADWYDPAGILAQATLVAVMRPGYADLAQYRARLSTRLPGIEQHLLTLEGPRMEISSTELRQRVAAGRPIKYQVPDVVEQYISQQKLYQSIQNRQTEQTKQEESSCHRFNLS